VYIEGKSPYINLPNINFPTVATFNYNYTTEPESKTGYYLTPEKLGTPVYLGRGYNIDIDYNKIELEGKYIDLNKYGPYTQGLTQESQNYPVKIISIDSRWSYEDLFSGNRTGTVINQVNKQKFIPYQSVYEITKEYEIGINRVPISWNNTFDFRNVALSSKHIAPLNLGNLIYWNQDIYGINYELYEDGLWTEYNQIALPANNSLSSVFAKHDEMSYYNSLTSNDINSFYVYKNTLIFEVSNNLIFENIVVNSTIEPILTQINSIDITNQKYYIWSDVELKVFVLNSISSNEIKISQYVFNNTLIKTSEIDIHLPFSDINFQDISICYNTDSKIYHLSILGLKNLDNYLITGVFDININTLNTLNVVCF